MNYTYGEKPAHGGGNIGHNADTAFELLMTGASPNSVPDSKVPRQCPTGPTGNTCNIVPPSALRGDSSPFCYSTISSAATTAAATFPGMRLTEENFI